MRSVFDFPELYGHVARFLTPHDIVQCLQVCRQFQNHFELYLYRELTVPPDRKISHYAWTQIYIPGQPLKQTISDDFIETVKQFELEMEARWRVNLRHVRSVDVEASGHTLSILRFLVSTSEIDTKGQDASLGLSSTTPAAPAVTEVQSLVRLRRLGLSCSDIVSERDVLNALYPSEHLDVNLLVSQTLCLPSCRLFLMELCLPISFLLLRDTNIKGELSYDDYEDAYYSHHGPDYRMHHHKDKISCQDFLGLVDTENGGLQQLKTLLFHIENEHLGGDTLYGKESWRALILFNQVLSKIKTLERFECRPKLQFYQYGKKKMNQLLAEWIYPQESRLQELAIYISGWGVELFLSLLLQSHGATLERLGCTLVSLGQGSNLGNCPSLQYLTLDKNRVFPTRANGSFNHQEHRVDSGYVKPLLHSPAVPTRLRFREVVPEDGDSAGAYTLIPAMDRLLETLEELVVDSMGIPSPASKLEDLLVVDCPRLLTFSVGGGGELQMRYLAQKRPTSWICSNTLRVLRLSVDRLPADSNPETLKEVDRFYERIGECRQLEELSIGYTVVPIKEKYPAFTFVTKFCQFWDLTLRSPASILVSSSLSSSSPSSSKPKLRPVTSTKRPKPRFHFSGTLGGASISEAEAAARDRAGSGLKRESASLQRLAGLSKLRILSLTRHNLWSRMRQREVEFMAEHWPKLQTIEIAVGSANALQHFKGQRHWQWLLRKKSGLNITRV